MKQVCRSMRKSILLLGGVGLFIAGLLDIKYKGLLYQTYKKISCSKH